MLQIGTEGRIRTDTPLLEPDFESGASTSFATPAFASRLHDSLLTLLSRKLLWVRDNGYFSIVIAGGDPTKGMWGF